MLDAASVLSEDELKRGQGLSFESVQANLAHVAASQIVWLARWSGQRSEALALLPQGFDGIRRGYEMSHEELRGFLASLREEDLRRTVTYRDGQGTDREGALWTLLFQVANHGTHHRAEVAMALTALGKPPRQLDYLFFDQERR